MIVKNEAHIIRRTLAMLCTKIRFDYWVICDTGSTDATREIIQDFFATEGIEGELHCDEWVNFAHNRTKALNYAHGKTDLLLVFDADDDIHGTITLPAAVTHDEYHLRFGAPNLGTSYTRTLLINNRKRFQYYSVVHEYISCLEPSANEHLRICVLDGDYYVVSGRSGARNQDPDKYLKDATILASAHAEALAKGDPLHKRYAFYCANSYRDCGRHEDAIRWCKTTLSQDNWAQEKYVSCLYAYNCYEALGQKEHGFFYLVKALHYDLERVECLYPLVVHYCCENANDVAYAYYRIVQPHYERAQMQSEPNSGSKLFLETDKPNFFVPYYMIIVADRVGDRACGVRMYEIIFRKKQCVLSAWHLKNLFFNLRFFIGHVKPDALTAFVALANEYLRFVREIGIPTSAFAEIAKDFNYDAYGMHLLTLTQMPKSCPVISPNFSRSECTRSKSILFYAGYSPAPWNHSSMLRGALGGSERAVAHLSQELYRQGYTVYVSGGVLEDIAGVGVKYVGLSDLPELLRTTPFHTIVCSRYVSFLELYGGFASWHQFYIWAHDTHLLSYGCDLSDTTILEKWSDHIDGCVCQTRWHADEYARQYPTLQSKIRVINNGIDAALFPSTLSAKVRNRFIYTSRTERGLSRILDLWPDIIAAMPDATLVISTYVAFPCNDDERRIQARIAHLNQVHPGQKEGQEEQEEQEHCIRHLGQLSPSQLYAEMGAAEYWLYPTDWPETSCITAMEMLMSGVICLYYPVAGLTDTMGGCGIQIAPGSELETLCRITSDETHQSKQREQERGRAYAEGCTWTHRAQQWVHALALDHHAVAYDFGILKSKSKSNALAPRIQKIVDFLKLNQFTMHEFERISSNDNNINELAKCKIILKINESNESNESNDDRWWVRLLDAGCNVLSEPSGELTANATMQKYPNLRVIAYHDFFDIGTMVDCYNNPFVSTAHNAHVLSVLNKCYYEIDFIPAAHVSFLKKLSLEFNPEPEQMVVYDIGSSVLHWSNHVKKIWKNSRIYAFDAMTEMKLFYDTYNATKNAAFQFEYNVGVLCDEDYKRIAFYQNDDLSGGNSYYKEIGHPNSHNIFTEAHVKHKMGMKLETVVKHRRFPLPDLIKIDVQGAELDILKGSMSIINCAKYLIVELQHVEYNRGAPLCNQTRDFLIENGWKVYAEKFSNNGPDADWCFINEHPTSTPAPCLRVAIFNSFPFHYEMFGYILHYLANLAKTTMKAAPCHVSVFTEEGNNWGWLDFYKQYFGERGLIFEYLPPAHFNSVKIRNQYDVIFVTTDDDFAFKREWIADRCIVIEHMYAARAPGYTHRIGVRPFADSSKPWALPCYEIVRNPAEKMGWRANDTHVHVAVIGGTEKIDTRLFNRMVTAAQSQSQQSRIKLHCIGRSWYPNCIRLESACVDLVIHGTLSAADMIHCLKTCDYVLTDIVNPDHINGNLMSGCIPLAFSTLTPIIVGRKNNSIYKFKSVIEIDLNSSEPIILEKLSHGMVSAVALERDELVRMAGREFDRCIQNQNHNSSASLSPIPKRVMQTWEHKQLNPQFQAIADTWKTHNPQCEFVLMDAAEREEFIRAHFERGVLTAYQRIVPGAYKSDLFRYCYLWVNGGVYADIDTLCLGSLDDFLIPGAELVVPIDLNLGANEGTHNLACGFIAAVPRHPAMMRCIQKIVRNVETGTVPGSKLDFSGPGVLGRAVNDCLNRGETASFVGNEGLHAPAKIHFLKFEPGTEFVKNMKNQVLFQNKNGNHEIANLYHAECCKLKDFVSWVQCASPIAVTHPPNESKKNVALMIYGQFRSYASNLRENVRMLAPVFTGKVVHVFVLSNQLASGNYSEQNERDIRGIIDQAGFNLCFFDYVENLGSHHAASERAAHDSYFAGLKNKDGVSNEVIPDIMYRKFALNQIKNAHCKQHGIDMDLHVFGRLFDVIIRHPVHASSDHTKRIQYEIDKLTVCSSDARTVLGSSDTLFIGTREPMDHLFECGVTQMRGPEIWNDYEFTEVMMRADSCLCIHRATYSPEVQYIAHMYFSGFKYRNIRFDFNNPESPENGSSLYDIRLDPRRLQYQ